MSLCSGSVRHTSLNGIAGYIRLYLKSKGPVFATVFGKKALQIF
jgi:hypothetical protein